MIKQQKIILPILIALFALPPVLLWAAATPLNVRFSGFSASMRSIGQILGLMGMSLFSLNFLLTARLKIFDQIFNGLNRVYINHHFIGGLAFSLLLMHPLMLGLRFLPVSVRAVALFFMPSFDKINVMFGSAALFLMMIILVLTFYISLLYHIWKFSHKFMAVAFFFAFLHIITIESDISASLPLRYYMIGLASLSFLAIGYRTLFSNFAVGHYRYLVASVRNLAPEITEISLQSAKSAMSYRAGQFAYFRFKNDANVTAEEHPFSLASKPDEPTLKVVVKNLGDYSNTLPSLSVGTIAEIEGPFGVFLKDHALKQIWIAGGIGVTPFLSRAHCLTPKENVIMFYSVRDEKEAICRKELEDISHSHPNFKFILWVSESAGRLTAFKIKETVGELEGLKTSICGPLPMMQSLKTQFKAMGVSAHQINTEEFNLL